MIRDPRRSWMTRLNFVSDDRWRRKMIVCVDMMMIASIYKMTINDDETMTSGTRSFNERRNTFYRYSECSSSVCALGVLVYRLIDEGSSVTLVSPVSGVSFSRSSRYSSSVYSVHPFRPSPPARFSLIIRLS
ncbi:uncharacterized protein LOC143353665 [Halictus rubicundus]|uniref:uncharacterized protein LOC143353665 n=1 Tax=Halictus rubicundus TaxID=77578 RepID=UPI004035AD82